MGKLINSAPAHEPAEVRLQRIFLAQQAAFRVQPYLPLQERLDRLKALRREIRRYQDVLAAAMSRDFGFRSVMESKMLDLLGCILQINHAIAHLGRWMKPDRRSTELLFLGNSLQVIYQPKGVVGVIVPWNFPVYLALGPLIAALAAGNRVMLKLSESTPQTNAVLARMLAEIFSEDEVAVVGGELVDPNVFTAMPFNHLVFTGSTAAGKAVMRTASANLTPVTLELGGKSPALVFPDYAIAEAARRITHGKGTNAGQVCVSPDYALVPRALVHDFVMAVQSAFSELFGASVREQPDYTSVVDERRLLRIHALLDDARAKGASVVSCLPYDAAIDKCRMPLHIVTGCTADMRILQEELFGPILPVVPYDSLEEATAFINAGSRPLALYCFTHDAGARQTLLRRALSGGVTINDWGWHLANHDAPFGGVGHSGMGSYHGIEGFRELSHARTVFKRRRFFPIDWFYPPYGKLVQRLVLRLWLGKGDEALERRE